MSPQKKKMICYFPDENILCTKELAKWKKKMVIVTSVGKKMVELDFCE